MPRRLLISLLMLVVLLVTAWAVQSHISPEDFTFLWDYIFHPLLRRTGNEILSQIFDLFKKKIFNWKIERRKPKQSPYWYSQDVSIWDK